MANKQQADRLYKVIKKVKKYPLSIRNDLIWIEHKPSTIAEYWVRIPVKSVKGGLWIGLIKPYEPIPTDAKDLNRVRGHYFWLRRKLGIKKAIDTIKKIGSHEKRIANDIIHNISRDIINQAY